MWNKLHSAIGDLDWGWVNKRSSKKVNRNLVAAVTFVMCQWRVRWKIYLDMCLPIYQRIQVKQFKNKEDLGDMLRAKENMDCIFSVFCIFVKWTTRNSHFYQSLAREGWKVNPCYVWDHCRLLLMRALQLVTENYMQQHGFSFSHCTRVLLANESGQP